MVAADEDKDEMDELAAFEMDEPREVVRLDVVVGVGVEEGAEVCG